MNKAGIVITGIYFSFVGLVFACELYTCFFDRGNSEMAGLGTFLLTSPSSFIIDWLSNYLFGTPVGSSDTAFVSILGLSLLLNSALIYLIISILYHLTRSSS